MIWLGLATLIVVFVVGFRVLTSDSRRAIRRLSERLGITPVPLESMIDQLGKTAGNEYLHYLELAGRYRRRQRAEPALLVSVDEKGPPRGAHYRSANPPGTRFSSRAGAGGERPARFAGAL